MKVSTILLLALCAAGVYPTVSVSRWFSATFYDLSFTLRRYGHCTGDLYPLRDYSLNENDYLIYQIKTFLDQGNYDNEQLSNVTALMDSICRPEIDQSYPISVNIDVNKFSNNHTEGKANRCQAIDDALDSMFYVFKRAALNRSEPLDFSSILFYPNATDRTATYNLTDLINTSWIKSETILEHVCNITDSVKRYVQARVAAASNSTLVSAAPASSSSATSSTADKRNEQQARVGLFTALFDLIDRVLDPLLGLERRFYWESNNRLEIVGNRLSSGLGSIRDGFGNRIKSTRDRLSGMFVGSQTLASNSTKSAQRFNGTQLFNVGSSANFSAPVVNATTLASSSTSFVSTTVAPSSTVKPPTGKPAVPPTITN